jgi:uncharacterized surface protein with fasciclin (FAS1) repeats
LAQASAANDVVSMLSSNENFSTLVSLVGAAGLVEALSNNGPFTVFAPTVSSRVSNFNRVSYDRTSYNMCTLVNPSYLTYIVTF